MTRFFYVKSMVVLLGAFAYVHAQAPDSAKATGAMTLSDSAAKVTAVSNASPDSGKASAMPIAAPLDTVAPAALPGTAQPGSESARMYESSVSRMRRDAPGQSNAPDTVQKTRTIKVAEEKVTEPPKQQRTDSISIVPKDHQTAGSPAKMKKSGVILAVGSCVLIGCGVAAYLLKNSKNDEIIAQNNRIPPPPAPPVN